MKVEHVPLLKIQRDLYRIPRGWERFREYLATMIDPKTEDLKLPLVAMNPMGKDHVPQLLDQYLAFDADILAASAVSQANEQLLNVPGEFKAALVIADDAKGGWTNRYFTEFSHRFLSDALHKRGWLTGLLWTSEASSASAVYEEMLLTIFRAAFIQQHGHAQTLRQMLAQEGWAMRMAGSKPPGVDAAELERIREIIRPHLDATDQPTLMECLFGDEAAVSLGYSAHGLSPRAGFALALNEAQVPLPSET